MAKSPHFIRIKGDVLRIVAHIPAGQLLSFADIGTHLDVMPRHVAYILATLEDQPKMLLPWHRVVGDNGKLGSPKYAPDGTTQAALIELEGLTILRGMVTMFDVYRTSVDELNSGVQRQMRPTTEQP